LPGNDISGWRLEDLGVALSNDAELCFWSDINGEMDLIAANKSTSVSEQEYQDTLLTGSG
jgi:hypothetical protein